jgi:hypothetical protein
MDSASSRLVLFFAILVACVGPEPCDAEVWTNEHGVERWVTSDGWGAWLANADRADIAAAVESGTIVPVGDDCFELIADGDPPLTCVVDAGCAEVLGRPLGEIAVTASPCAQTDMWETVEIVDPETSGLAPACYAVLGNYLVEVTNDPR